MIFLHNLRKKKTIHAKAISFLNILCYVYTVRTKRVIALLIMFSMTICCVMGNEMNPAHAEETSKNLVVKAENNLNGSIEMEISITASWDNHYNADVTLANKLNEKIDNWMIAFDFNNNIENIWNAKIISHEEDHYVVSLTMPNRNGFDLASSG